ncbi:MAG TPA: GNAT family N-acetyltransferase [Parafilimonas sp.]|nr:GNAT family N-acetyltransferase [Parafilimonas sp.]
MINIRHATEDDLQSMLDIYNEIIMNNTAIFQYDLHTLEQRKEWFAQKEKQNYPVFVAEENNMVAGFSTFGQFRNWQAYQYSVENSIYVKADRRGKGIGKLLLQPLIDAAKERQLHTIIAGIVADNEASIALHKQFGFVEVAHFKEVGYKFDKWLDLKFLQLML